MARTPDELVRKIEAVLFAAGKPMSPKELAGSLEVDDARTVSAALRNLEKAYADRASALEVRRVGDRYALQLREEYVPVVHAVTPVEMAPRTLKALTLVAYHQPILQSVLVRMIGEVAYGEVQHLRGLGLLHTEPKGATLELTTTRRFAEYFGIASGRPEEIRRFLEQKLGVPPAGAAASLDGVVPPAPETAPPTGGADGESPSEAAVEPETASSGAPAAPASG